MLRWCGSGGGGRGVPEPSWIASDMPGSTYPWHPTFPGNRGCDNRRVPTRFDLTPDDLAALLPGEPAYRARQVWRGLPQGRDPVEMTDLPGSLRQRLPPPPPAP